MTWYEEMYAKVDEKDMDAVGGWFADDIVLTNGNGEPVVGRDSVVEGLRGFQSTFAGLAHTFIAVAEQGDVTMLETRTTFELWSGKSVDCEGVTVLERSGGLVTSMRMHADMTPLWAAMEPSKAASAFIESS